MDKERLIYQIRLLKLGNRLDQTSYGLIHKIAALSQRYEAECCSEAALKKSNIELGKLQDDWWEALKYFLLVHAFYQGRRDDVSEQVAKKAHNVLSKYFDDKQNR